VSLVPGALIACLPALDRDNGRLRQVFRYVKDHWPTRTATPNGELEVDFQEDGSFSRELVHHHSAPRSQRGMGFPALQLWKAEPTFTQLVTYILGGTAGSVLSDHAIQQQANPV